MPQASNEPQEPILQLLIEGAPQGKGRPRSRIVRPRGKSMFIQVYPDPDSAKTEEMISIQARIAMRGIPIITGAAKLEVLCMFAVPKSWPQRDRIDALAGDLRPLVKPDWDNLGKLVSDAFNEIVWKDDSQVVDAHVQKFYGERAFTHVEVYR